jgi:hypothetical protein
MTQPSQELVHILQDIGDAGLSVVIHSGVYLQRDHWGDRFRFPRRNDDWPLLTEAHKAEIIAVFGPGPDLLDAEFLQDLFCPPRDRQAEAMAARDGELANESTDRKLKAQLGVAEGERLMVAVYLPGDLEFLGTPEEEAAAIVARLREPVAMMSEDGELLAFVRPSKSA